MKRLIISTTLILIIIAECSTDKDSKSKLDLSNGIQKLEYNNPGLTVDLDGGFKVLPMPMDFDGDGDYDLLLSESGAYAEAGIFYFENSGTKTKYSFAC